MQQFEDAVVTAFRQMAESGALNSLIEKTVAKTVEDVVGHALRQYSDFGKKLEAAVTAQLQFDPSDFGLAGYNHTILQVAKRTIEQHIATLGAKQVEESLSSMLSGTAPAVVKLSDLANDFREWVRHDSLETKLTDYCTILVRRSDYGYVQICFDPREGKEWYECRFDVGVNKEGKVYALKFERRDASKTLFAGEFSGFERKLFALRLAGSKLIIDTEHPDTELPAEKCSC